MHGAGWMSQRVSESEWGWVFALLTCVIILSQTVWRAWMFFCEFQHTPRDCGNAFTSCYKCSAELRYDNWIQLAACSLNTLLPLGQEQMAVKFLHSYGRILTDLRDLLLRSGCVVNLLLQSSFLNRLQTKASVANVHGKKAVKVR
jgi:hypothetical protein